ncbi:hypothetical protein AAW51_1225 [Caldimonas brevitalea]|uniref:O-antigen ligase n=2 Tax=Caldimonas brevitalea TaxID=413882 RepID=A0A0G3BKM9_9BURK|nr:hypothetical protein AAW51_1225 [Caldimonas brevitalea]
MIEDLYMVFCLVAFWLSLSLPMLRHFTYLIPLIGLVGCLALGKCTFPQHLWPFLLLVVVGAMLGPLSGRDGLQDIYLILIGVMPFALGQRYRFGWWPVFMVAVIGAVVAIVLSKATGGRVSADAGIDVLGSKSAFESPYSFVFGMLTVWAVVTKRWKEALIALVFTVLTLKRIALLGVIACVLVTLLPRRLGNLLLSPVVMISLNALAVTLAVMYAMGQFDQLIFDLTGMSANQAGMGRRVLYFRPSMELTAHLERYVFVGGGAGWVYDIMRAKASWGHKGNLHNDVMKIVLEYGGLAMAGFFWLAYRTKSWPIKVLWLYVNLTLLTDNTLIYTYFVFGFGMIAMTADAEWREAAAAAAAKARAAPRPRQPRPLGPGWTRLP